MTGAIRETVPAGCCSRLTKVEIWPGRELYFDVSRRCVVFCDSEISHSEEIPLYFGLAMPVDGGTCVVGAVAWLLAVSTLCFDLVVRLASVSSSGALGVLLARFTVCLISFARRSPGLFRFGIFCSLGEDGGVACTTAI